MSYVTTVVFATDDDWAAARYEQIIREHYNRYEQPYQISPTEQDGPKYGPGEVYYHGFNFLNQEVLDLLRAEPWPDSTILWINCEGETGPEVRVGPVCVVKPRPHGLWG